MREIIGTVVQRKKKKSEVTSDITNYYFLSIIKSGGPCMVQLL